MHPEAMDFITEQVNLGPQPEMVVEFGSRDVNGTPRHLFVPGVVTYWGVDIEDGPGVDEVANAATWVPRRTHVFDIAICAEVFEHTPHWPSIVRTAWLALRNDGLFIITCAADPREPHSAVDGWDLRPGEYYKNVNPSDIDFLAAGPDAGNWRIETLRQHPHGDTHAALTAEVPYP